jgi:hypothetical protein
MGARNYRNMSDGGNAAQTNMEVFGTEYTRTIQLVKIRYGFNLGTMCTRWTVQETQLIMC